MSLSSGGAPRPYWQTVGTAVKLAALAGFATGTAIVVWTFLRSLSHGESELDPMDEVQTADPYVYSLLLDCE